MSASEAPVALVTGGARGIGAAVVRRLAARGYRVTALDSCAGADSGLPYALATSADLEALAAEHPGTVSTTVADVRDADALTAAADAVVREHGRLDAVVAAAAVMAGGDPLWEADPAQVELLWSVDVLGVLNTARATVPHLISGGEHGRDTAFVAVTSAAGDHGLWHLGGYCMAKHAVVGLVRALAADLRGTRVTVTGVAPGSTGTPMLAATAAIYGLESVDDLAAGSDVARVLDPDEVARVVEHACTAGPVLAGALLPATGGFR